MQKRMIQIAAILILIAGITIFLYPRVCQKIYEYKTNEIVISFEEDIGQPKEDDIVPEEDDRLEKLYQKMAAENKKLYEQGQKDLKDPFSYEQPGIELEEYGISDNIVGYLSIPKIDQTLPVYLGANGENMSKGAVHLTNTSYPIGGANTNSVIAAHRGFSTAVMFRDIQELELKDDVWIKNFREKLHYQVSEVKIIQPDEVEQILIQPGKEMITLISCHPYGQNDQRYLVYCERVYEEEEK